MPKRVWTKEEMQRRERLVAFLDRASEDEFLENILVPLFRQLGFQRISVAGHRDKLRPSGRVRYSIEACRGYARIK